MSNSHELLQVNGRILPVDKIIKHKSGLLVSCMWLEVVQNVHSFVVLDLVQNVSSAVFELVCPIFLQYVYKFVNFEVTPRHLVGFRLSAG